MKNEFYTLLETLKIEFKQSSQGCVLNIETEIKPQSKKDLIEWKGPFFKIFIKAQAIEGKANVAVRDFLAESLKLPKSSVELIKGEKSRKKTFLVLVPDDKLKLVKNVLENFYGH